MYASVGMTESQRGTQRKRQIESQERYVDCLELIRDSRGQIDAWVSGGGRVATSLLLGIILRIGLAR